MTVRDEEDDPVRDPVAALDPVGHSVDHTSVTASTEPGDEQLVVLYIEDDVINLRLMESVMELRPVVTLITAMRGRRGLAIARDQHPDLVLVDLHLPDVGGQEVLGALRGDPATASLAIGVVSGDATPSRADELRALGADHYLTKPIDIHDLIDVIDRQLVRKREGP